MKFDLVLKCTFIKLISPITMYNVLVFTLDVQENVSAVITASVIAVVHHASVGHHVPSANLARHNLAHAPVEVGEYTSCV